MRDSLARLTVEQARRDVVKRLALAGNDSAELDARLLVGHTLRLDLTGIIAAASRALTPDEARGLEILVDRRLAGEPVARILGTKEFWGLPLHLSPATLVPRPDTETVVELSLDMLRDGGPNRRERIADVLKQTDAVGYARQRAERFAAEACEQLNEVPPSEFRDILRSLPMWAVRREA